MNIRSITMGQALETLAQQSRIVPTLIFPSRGSESVSSYDGMGEEPFPNVMDPEVLLPQEGEDNNFGDQFQFLQRRTTR